MGQGRVPVISRAVQAGVAGRPVQGQGGEKGGPTWIVLVRPAQDTRQGGHNFVQIGEQAAPIAPFDQDLGQLELDRAQIRVIRRQLIPEIPEIAGRVIQVRVGVPQQARLGQQVQRDQAFLAGRGKFGTDAGQAGHHLVQALPRQCGCFVARGAQLGRGTGQLSQELQPCTRRLGRGQVSTQPGDRIAGQGQAEGGFLLGRALRRHLSTPPAQCLFQPIEGTAVQPH